MSVCVQAVQMPGGDRTWTVLGADHRHVGPAEEFLEHHRITGSSPHTVRAYARALQLWWRYLELDGRDWAGADVPALAGFVAWLREGIPPGVVLLDPAAAAPPRLAESTLAARLAAEDRAALPETGQHSEWRHGSSACVIQPLYGHSPECIGWQLLVAPEPGGWLHLFQLSCWRDDASHRCTRPGHADRSGPRGS
jgi:hypothetical protein